MRIFQNGRQQGSERRSNGAVLPPDPAALTQQIAEVQSVTASAIFALLVSKGVISAIEAADYMGEIGLTLQRDLGSPVATSTGRRLGDYGNALVAADG